MSSNEVWEISATVDAYLAARDTVSDFRSNDATWQRVFDSSQNPYGGVSTIDMYRLSIRLGMMPTPPNDFYYGLYYNRQDFGGIVNYNDSTSIDAAQFRNTAHKYNMSRIRCHGHWQANRTSILLTGGDCDLNTPVNSSVLNAPNAGPYDIDVLPSAAHIVANLTGPANSQDQPEATWLDANYVITTVTVYWARALYMMYTEGRNDSVLFYGGPYNPVNQTIVSTRQTLHASPLLYVVLLVQPTITLIALLVTIWLHTVPVGQGFGITSILSGFDTGGSQSIAGAGLSGKLKSPVILSVNAQASEGYSSPPHTGTAQTSWLTYRLTNDYGFSENPRLQKGRTYG